MNNAGRVLIVDNDPDFGKNLKAELELLQHEVLVAYDISSGLLEADIFQPHLIILDHELSSNDKSLDGKRLFRMLKNKPSTKSISVIIVTNYPEQEQEYRSLEVNGAYIQDFIPKSETLDRKVMVIDHWLKRIVLPFVFISHSGKDDNWVMQLEDDLLSNGIASFTDHRHIRIGQRFSDIDKALDDAKIMVVVLSKTSVANANVRGEFTKWLNSKPDGTLLPLVIDDCKIPFQLGEILYLDFRQNVAYNTQLTTLVRAIKSIT